MNNMQKPKYFNTLFSIIQQLINLILTIVGLTQLPKNFTVLEITNTVIMIYIISIILCIVLYSPIYSILLFRYCKKIEDENSRLSIELQSIKNDYENLQISYNQLHTICFQITGNIKNELFLDKENPALRKLYDNVVERTQNFELYKN